MSITFLGTGTAFNHDGRGSQSLLVRSSSASPFLVDAGPTMMAAIMRERIDCATIDRLFLTHLHGDHVAGWPFLLLHFVILHERREPFDVHGPLGTRECLEGLARHCYGELLQRRQFDLRFHELDIEPARGFSIESALTLDVLPLQHHGSSIGLRFRLGGNDCTRSVAVSGDTGWCENLEELARDTDLLILECTSLESTVDVHVSLAEVRQRIDRLGAREVVLTHLPDDVAESLAIDPVPRVSPAHDGMKIHLNPRE